MTSTLSRTNSAAISAARSARPSAQRYSTATVRPSTQPSSRSRCTKAAVHWLMAESVLEVEDDLILGRHLHRQVGGLLAFEDAIDVAGRLPVLVDEIWPIGNQAAGADEVAVVVDRRQLVLTGARDDQIA